MAIVGHRFRTDPDELDKLWARLPETADGTLVMEPTRSAWVVLVPPEQSADLRGCYNKYAQTGVPPDHGGIHNEE